MACRVEHRTGDERRVRPKALHHGADPAGADAAIGVGGEENLATRRRDAASQCMALVACRDVGPVAHPDKTQSFGAFVSGQVAYHYLGRPELNLRFFDKRRRCVIGEVVYYNQFGTVAGIVVVQDRGDARLDRSRLVPRRYNY